MEHKINYENLSNFSKAQVTSKKMWPKKGNDLPTKIGEESKRTQIEKMKEDMWSK